MSSCSKICCCSVTMSCPTLCKPMNYSLPGSSILHYLLEFAQNTQFIAGAQRLRAITIIFYLAASGLSCSTQDLSASCRIFLWGVQTLSLQHTGLLYGMWDLSSPTREQTYVPCIARHILNHWTTREVLRAITVITVLVTSILHCRWWKSIPLILKAVLLATGANVHTIPSALVELPLLLTLNPSHSEESIDSWNGFLKVSQGGADPPK